MKLSEAIIKGCEGTHKICGHYSDYKNGYCAPGAAMHGIGVAEDISAPWDFAGHFPVLRASAKHPETGRRTEVFNAIISLNDNYNWPRLSIAEWIANVVEPEFERGC